MTPIVPSSLLHNIRDIYAINIHNKPTRVKKIVAQRTIDNNPAYKTAKENILALYTGFTCSVFNLLSDKMGRIFDVKLEELQKELGKVNLTVYTIQYVCDTVITDPTHTYPDKLNNLSIGEEVEINNAWYKVIRVVPDSEGVQHSVLVVK